MLPTREVLARPAPQQPCGLCPHRTVCWRTPQGTAIALSVCRIQSRIDVDQSTARLIEASWPTLVQIARTVDPTRPLEIARDLAREVVEAAPSYIFGGGAEPIWWLLTNKRSAARLAASRMNRERQRERRRFLELDGADIPIAAPPSDEAAEERVVLADAAWRVIEDGATLSTLEYRVLTYLVDHAGRHAIGLQNELAVRMGVTRSRVTRLYHLAIVRVRHALGETATYFKARGVTLPSWTHGRRRAWAARVMPQPAMLTVAQRADFVAITQRVRLTEAEIAWGFGLGPTRRSPATTATATAGSRAR